MEDFFRELEESLRGEVPESEIRDSLNYYRQYFAEQKAMGYSENEIIESLGSPRLIARSIMAAVRQITTTVERRASITVARVDIMAADRTAEQIRMDTMMPEKEDTAVMRTTRQTYR